MKFLSPQVHGVLDYLLGALFIAAPFMFGFVSPLAQIISLAIGASVILLSLLTRYPLGVLRVIPFPVHGAVEFVAALALIAMPWFAGFEGVPPARNFFVATGVALFAVWLTTDYKAAELTTPSHFGRGTHDRHHPAATR